MRKKPWVSQDINELRPKGCQMSVQSKILTTAMANKQDSDIPKTPWV